MAFNMLSCKELMPGVLQARLVEQQPGGVASTIANKGAWPLADSLAGFPSLANLTRHTAGAHIVVHAAGHA